MGGSLNKIREILDIDGSDTKYQWYPREIAGSRNTKKVIFAYRPVIFHIISDIAHLLVTFHLRDITWQFELVISLVLNTNATDTYIH